MRSLPLALLLAGCASSGAGSSVELVDAAQVPGLQEKVKGMLGHHFHLDTLGGRHSLESGLAALLKGHSDLIIHELRTWKSVYGTQLVLEHPREGGKVTVMLWSNSPDFSGGLVYADSENGSYWHAYLAGKAPKK